ncbi:TetR/AcrR family transcriptional regulator [Arthrobacter sp. zg-Y820]|uniref:TetR/AcrR family transcriptional regulator n=1 Tax=unclassified Arthrobacter TaxID=235627 RepID=UPI001E528DFD|nr:MULTISPECIES: TetR/AcrR family transcriptional regulator [unclassified Arthrobacter]MCC9197267.1 TetR/AcrR family transcriptional regulator [Arthrobacter sp. zg-Y820]MDK1280132.1 TetR/AcrR family transcriptional regulator [Arthrobacter sp. zg.Y820]MDK1360730.1 TetR/AcrR family transcriptional regulator [Arthrobacter sp. zg-Y1219]WIB09424.1 TetR/AcrR family transcriptional regulator [Arthrobacter sp. zg-Y820]
MPGPETPLPPRRPVPDEPRSARTREALENGLWELLRDSDLAEISVAGLCRQAGVHRTTFYGHHRNIFDFAASVYVDVVNRLGAVDVDQRGTGRTQAEVGVLYADALRRILEHTRSERRTYRLLFSTGTFQEVLAEGLRPRFLLAVYAWEGYGLVPDLDCEVAAAFLGGAYASWIEQWVAGDDDDVEAWLASLPNLLPAWWPRDGFPQG